MRTESVDVVVVGAGPAGLAAARETAAAGLDTLVVERQRQVAEHVRTSGATAVSTVARLGAPARLFHVFERFRLVSPGETAVVETGDALCALDVRGFYRWLADEAVAAGARVAVATHASGVVVREGIVSGVELSGPDGPARVEARVVVDAGGHRAQVSKRAGLHPGFARFGVGAEYELLAPAADQREAVLIVGERYAPAGYAWSFPWGGQRVRLGVGLHHRDVRDDPKERLALLYREGDELALGVSGAEIAEYHFGLIPADGLAPRLVGDGIVAVGDAAGQATLVVGEGIRISLLAGELAAETIAAALRAGRRDAAALAPYERRFLRAFDRELRFGRRLNHRLASRRGDERWDARVRLLRTLPADLVVDLLQSKLRPGGIAAWYLRRPWRIVRSATLARAALGRS